MLTYTGRTITKEEGAPSVKDIAVHLMRELRYGGASEKLWPVGLHSMVVADLVKVTHPEYELDALLHDATEACGIRDVCQPMKTFEGKMLEKDLLLRIYKSLHLEAPSSSCQEVVHLADMRAARAERLLGCGSSYDITSVAGIDALKAVRYYLNEVSSYRELADGCLDPYGDWTLTFENRIWDCLSRKLKRAA